MTKNELLKPATLNIREFLSEGKYVIPIYQRNYDWGEREALQLLEDISDYAQKNKEQDKEQNKEQPYYIGSAVVFLRTAHGETYFETIDGQQRLTTLTILACLLKHQKKAGWFEKPNLSYDHRKEADEALMMLVNGQLSQHPSAQNIVSVYRLFEKHLQPMLTAKRLDLETFAAYLFEKVIILRIPVPQDTQLNHYFEIMNTRGEQLEKHEVLKAVLMGKLEREEHHLFHLIWEACSDMSAYVQMNFSVGMRNLLFTKEWSELRDESFDEGYFDKLYKALPQKKSDNPTNIEDGAPHTLDSLFKDANNPFTDAKRHKSYPLPSDGNADKGKSERFGSIINFPNFLLQVLKVCYHGPFFNQKYPEAVDAQIRLDDKALIPTFQAVLSSLGSEDEKTRFVKYFIMQLLLLRTRYDRYVIKREYVNGTESWSLKKLKYDTNHKTGSYINTFSSSDNAEDAEPESDIGKEIRLLEAMFHVSAPTQIYKHWLNAVLYHVHTTDPQAASLRNRLYDLARCYMLDVYLAKDGKKYSFEEIVYRKEGIPQNHIDDIDWGAINQGCNVQNFIFNFYDFILWREKLEQHLRRKKSEQDEKSRQHEKFDFTYRTSVEHFYPQKPMPGYPPLPTEYLNSFGNLCLISSSMNSKFSNNMPKAKYDNFGSSEEMCSALSLKLQEMMECVKEGEWEKDQIKAHYEEARENITNALQAE